MTKKTAISLPDDLYRKIERARQRAKLDRSTWLQEAAGEYLKKADADEVEAWYAGYEQVPVTEDERSFMEFGTKNFGKLIDALEASPRRPARRRKRAT
jgi:metal-responsive CopG/Arc/MetJ family transcriptional regulator